MQSMLWPELWNKYLTKTECLFKLSSWGSSFECTQTIVSKEIRNKEYYSFEPQPEDGSNDRKRNKYEIKTSLGH